MLYAAKWLHRAFERHSFENVFAFFCDGKAITYTIDEGVGNAFYIVVPMAIHEVSNQSSCSLGKVTWILLNDIVIGHLLDDNHLLLVGREEETFYFAVGLCQLLASLAVGVHRPHFAFRGKSQTVVG